MQWCMRPKKSLVVPQLYFSWVWSSPRLLIRHSTVLHQHQWFTRKSFSKGELELFAEDSFLIASENCDRNSNCDTFISKESNEWSLRCFTVLLSWEAVLSSTWIKSTTSIWKLSDLLKEFVPDSDVLYLANWKSISWYYKRHVMCITQTPSWKWPKQKLREKTNTSKINFI